MASKWCVDHVEILIESYEKHPCLYNVKSPMYHNKHARNEALAAVARAVSGLRPGTSADEVKSKFCKLRSHFVAEYNKKKISEKSGAGTDEVYEPNFWYYKKLLFLVAHIVPRKGSETKLKNVPVSRVWEPLLVYDEDQSLGDLPSVTDTQVSTQDTTQPLPFNGGSVEEEPGASGKEAGTLDEQPAISQQPGTSNSFQPFSRTPKTSCKKQKHSASEDSYTSILNSVAQELKREQPRLTENERFGQWIDSALDNIKDKQVCMNAKHEIMKVLMGAEVDDFNSTSLH